jgi:hypothetical protein
MCATYDDGFQDFIDDCGDLAPFAVRGRYPEGTEITEWQAESAVKKAERIHKFCSERIQELRLAEQEQDAGPSQNPEQSM